MAKEEIVNPFDVKDDYYRTMAQNIDDSYSHEWDILAELIQNSVDAIRQRSAKGEEFAGRIDITIDHDSRRVTIRDNGIGFPQNKISEYLRLFSSGKQKDTRTVGEKGVGLKFAIFSCDEFELESSDGKSAVTASCDGALAWKKGVTDKVPSIKIFPAKDITRGTVVALGGMGDHPIFSWSSAQLKMALLTKTALGDVRSIWKEESGFAAGLRIRKGAEETYEEVECVHMTPIKFDQNNAKAVSLVEFEEFASKPNRRDEEKRNKIFKKLLYAKKELESGERIFAYFLPARELWKEYSHAVGITDQDIEEREELSFRPGIYVSIKGMPTGIRVEPPQTGQSGYWQNLAVIIDFDQLKFDIGRKSLTGRQVEKVRRIAKEIFAEFTRVFVAWGTEKGPNVTGDWLASAEELLQQINSLNLSEVTYKGKLLMERDPSAQEAAVSAIFYQLLALGVIREFTPVSAGYKNQYDFYARDKSGKLKMFEFKSRLRHILSDFEEMIKEASQMDVLICWDVDEEDRRQIEGAAIMLVESEGDDEVAATFYGHATHYIKFPGGKLLPVIDLKRFLERRNRES